MITIIEEDIPDPKAGDVRVKVLAAGVSLPDVLVREGVHPETPHVPYTPEFAPYHRSYLYDRYVPISVCSAVLLR